MIVSFADKHTRTLFEDGVCHREWRAIETTALDTLDILDAAVELKDLRLPPGNRLKALKGDWTGCHQIRINDQYRVRFRWTANGPEDVIIGDWHD